jgi:hypothetical protein
MEQDPLVISDLEKRPMLKRKAIIWSLALIASVWFSFWGIPVSYLNSATTLIAIVGSIVITISLVMVYFACTFLFFPGKKDNSYEGYVIFALILFALFGSGILVIKQSIYREGEELINYGVITQATVEDGSSFATRRVDLTKIKLVFKTADGEERTVYQPVSHKNFDMFYKGQEMTIVYSSRYPSMAQILYHQDDIDRYRKLISDRK